MHTGKLQRTTTKDNITTSLRTHDRKEALEGDRKEALEGPLILQLMRSRGSWRRLRTTCILSKVLC